MIDKDGNTETHCFTGQEFVEGPRGKEYVKCSVCKEIIGLRTNAFYDSYNDPHQTGGSYVHEHCLSEERKKEIKEYYSKEIGE